MDVVAILGTGVTALFLVFGLGEDVRTNSRSIDIVAQEVKRVDERQVKTEAKLIDSIEVIRVEAKEGRQRINDKLDRLIENMR